MTGRNFTTRYVADRFRVHVKTVRRWINDGKIEAFVSPGGRDYLIPGDAIAALEGQRGGTQGDTRGQSDIEKRV